MLADAPFCSAGSTVSAGSDEFKKAVRNGADYISDQDEDALTKVLWSLAHVASYIMGVPVSKVAGKAAKGAGQEGGPQRYVIPAPGK